MSVTIWEPSVLSRAPWTVPIPPRLNLLVPTFPPKIFKQQQLTRHTYSQKINLLRCQAADALRDLDNCAAAYFRQPGGSMCFWGLWLPLPPTISTVLQDFKHSLCSPNPPVPALQGNQAPGPKFHIPLRCSSAARLAWYARILSAVLAFYFSNSYDFTFKVGHHWRTERLFCIQIPSDGGWVVSQSPPVSRICLCMHVWTLRTCGKKKKKRFVFMFMLLYHQTLSVF